MNINTYEDIENLFDGEIPESDSLDYKKELYTLTKFQKKDNPKNNNDKFEVLKDICSFLNSGGGSIVIGIKDDPKKGIPTGLVSTSGVSNDNIPPKYFEILERLVSTGISPTCRIHLKAIDNIRNSNTSFIVINIPVQTSPLFARIKNESGDEDYSIFVRQGRNTSKMSPRDIENAIVQFNNRATQFYDKLPKTDVNQNSDHLVPFFSVFPGIPLQFNALEYGELIRGKDSWEISEPNYKVSYDALNVFPIPTLYGIEIRNGHKRLHVHEDGFISWESRSFDSTTIRFLNENGQKNQNPYKLIDPNALIYRVLNFVRFSCYFYSEIKYEGFLNFRIHLLGTKKALLNRSWENYFSDIHAANDSESFLSIEKKDSYYGPKSTENKDIILEMKIENSNYSISNTNDLDLITKKYIIVYLWRAFGYESSPNI